MTRTPAPRKVNILVLLFVLSTAAHSQINKGQWMIGGSASFSRSHTKEKNEVYQRDSKSTLVQGMPGAGYFVLDKLAVGLRAGVNHSNAKYVLEGNNVTYLFMDTRSKATSLSVSPFARYYILPATSKVNVLADAGYIYGRTKERTESIQVYSQPGGMPSESVSMSTTKDDSHSFSISAGPAFFLNPKVSLEVTVGYLFSDFGGVTNKKDNSFIAGLGFQVHLNK